MSDRDMTQPATTRRRHFSVCVPAELRDAMRKWDAYVSWSRIAAEAFAREVQRLRADPPPPDARRWRQPRVWPTPDELRAARAARQAREQAWIETLPPEDVVEATDMLRAGRSARDVGEYFGWPIEMVPAIRRVGR